MIVKKDYWRGLVLVGLAVALFFGVGCSAGEMPEEVYASYEEAVGDGAIERGWIPEWLPQTAVDIHEKHDLDRNHSILMFDAGSSFVMPEGCEPAAGAAEASLSASWWPDSEVSELPAYDCGGGLLAVGESGSQVYFWRP